MSLSTDLLEMAQTGINRIVEDHNRGRAEAARKSRNNTRILFVCVVLYFATSMWLQSSFVQELSQPPDPAVTITLTSALDNPVLCPGETMTYEVVLTIVDAAVVESDQSVLNLDTRRTEIFSDTARLIHSEPGSAPVVTNWTLPYMLPAAAGRPERPWQAGQYRRSIAITNVTVNSKPQIVNLDFRIDDNCAGVL